MNGNHNPTKYHPSYELCSYIAAGNNMAFSRVLSVLLMVVVILGLYGTVLAHTDDDNTPAGEGHTLKDTLHVYLISNQ